MALFHKPRVFRCHGVEFVGGGVVAGIVVPHVTGVVGEHLRDGELVEELGTDGTHHGADVIQNTGLRATDDLSCRYVEAVIWLIRAIHMSVT